MYKVIMAIGNAEIEDYISDISGLQSECFQDIDLIKEVLEYDSFDYVIINTLLSQRKSVQLADFVDNMEGPFKPKIIALLDSEDIDDKFITQMVGFGVNAFVDFENLNQIGQYISNYPEEYSLAVEGQQKEGLNPLSKLFSKKKANGTVLKTKKHSGMVKPTQIIGIYGVERGVGATSLCLILAEELAGFGRVAVLDKTEHKELEGLNWKGIDFYEGSLRNLNIASYNYIIIDFGIPLEIGNIGGLATIISSAEENEKVEQRTAVDRNYCNEIYCVAPSESWKLYKTDFLINNPAFKDVTEKWNFVFHSSSEMLELCDFDRKMYIMDNDGLAKIIEKIR